MFNKRQVPHADPGTVCPLHRRDMSEVCHTCAWWTQVRGKHPQSNEEIDHWNCAVGWIPMLLIEGAQQSRQTGAAVESFRNEMVKANESNTEMLLNAARLNGARRLT